ncbi:MAG: hypothetical protein FWD76_00550 [Firmicutes bacterium]|nr:hypothetical protein [Bacillota bacterium]
MNKEIKSKPLFLKGRKYLLVALSLCFLMVFAMMSLGATRPFEGEDTSDKIDSRAFSKQFTVKVWYDNYAIGHVGDYYVLTNVSFTFDIDHTPSSASILDHYFSLKPDQAPAPKQEEQGPSTRVVTLAQQRLGIYSLTITANVTTSSSSTTEMNFFYYINVDRGLGGVLIYREDYSVDSDSKQDPKYLGKTIISDTGVGR